MQADLLPEVLAPKFIPFHNPSSFILMSLSWLKCAWAACLLHNGVDCCDWGRVGLNESLTGPFFLLCLMLNILCGVFVLWSCYLYILWHVLYYSCRYQPAFGQQHIWGCISSSWGKAAFVLTEEIHRWSNCEVPPVMFISALFASSGWIQEQTSYQDARCPESQAPSLWALGSLGHLVQIPASGPHQVMSFEANDSATSCVWSFIWAAVPGLRNSSCLWSYWCVV